VIFPTHRQAPLTPAAIKASAGAVEHLLLCPVDDLPGALSDLRVRGLQIAAAEADAPLTAAQADLRGPLAIVVGSEGQGLSPAMRRRSDVAVRIPMRGAIGSLNAAVAGSILLFAAVAQRDPAGVGDKPARPVGAEAWPVRNEPKPARGQSVGLPSPTEDALEPAAVSAIEATGGTAKPRRRTRAAAPVSDVPSEPEPGAVEPAGATTAKKRRSRKQASDDIASATPAPAKAPEASPATPKPARRLAAKATGQAAAKPTARRSNAKFAKAASPTKDAKATKAPKSTRPRTKGASSGASEPAADGSPDVDELLPGGPDPH